MFKSTRYLVLITALIGFNNISLSQKERDAFFFNEFLVAANYSTVEDRNTSNDFGWGFGAYRRGFDSSRVNMIFGFEFCQTKQHKEVLSTSTRSTGYDVDLAINYIRIPLAARYNFFQKGKLFSELGASLAVPLGARMSGEFRGYTPDGDLVSSTFSDGYRPRFNLGGLISLGSRIPLQKLDLLFKAHYTYDILPQTVDDGPVNSKIYNGYLSISAGIALW